MRIFRFSGMIESGKRGGMDSEKCYSHGIAETICASRRLSVCYRINIATVATRSNSTLTDVRPLCVVAVD